ncbi:MAG: hypothetical protein GXO38_02225 [Epsilonproteobacteria bacterium]|nr:hypothetical protein [Campylobacterota bacterium]
MIAWMQKHKKYLVITIWISTIAFVGAGFVGWGAYKFGSAADAIAQVGDVKISYKEFQQEYTRRYQAYNQAFNGKFDQAMAKKMKLDQEVLQALIQEALLVNLAHDLGLIVTDEEVAREIASMPLFANKQGRFDKELYVRILANNHLKPKDFEEQVRRDLLIRKLLQALKAPLFDLEFNTTASALFIADKIEYKPLEAKTIAVERNESAIENYYQLHKERYKSPTRYKIALLELNASTIPIDEGALKAFYQKHKSRYTDNEGKIVPFQEARPIVEEEWRLKQAKREALKQYVALKKGELSPQQELIVDEKDNPFGSQLLEKLREAKVQSTLKPIQVEGGYIVVQLLERQEPQILPYQQVRQQVERDWLAQERQRRLEAMAQKLLEQGFEGVRTDYICRDDVDKIHLLDPMEAALFLKELFVSKEEKGAIPLTSGKVVLYKVLDQRLTMPQKIDKNRKFIHDTGERLKGEVQSRNLLHLLQQRYPIEIYYKGR